MRMRRRATRIRRWRRLRARRRGASTAGSAASHWSHRGIWHLDEPSNIMYTFPCALRGPSCSGTSSSELHKTHTSQDHRAQSAAHLMLSTLTNETGGPGRRTSQAAKGMDGTARGVVRIRGGGVHRLRSLGVAFGRETAGRVLRSSFRLSRRCCVASPGTKRPALDISAPPVRTSNFDGIRRGRRCTGWLDRRRALGGGGEGGFFKSTFDFLPPKVL